MCRKNMGRICIKMFTMLYLYARIRTFICFILCNFYFFTVSMEYFCNCWKLKKLKWIYLLNPNHPPPNRTTVQPVWIFCSLSTFSNLTRGFTSCQYCVSLMFVSSAYSPITPNQLSTQAAKEILVILIRLCSCSTLF
jgi:hypothetical protein